MKNFQRVKFWSKFSQTGHILLLKKYHASDNGYKSLKRFKFSNICSHSIIHVCFAFCVLLKNLIVNFTHSWNKQRSNFNLNLHIVHQILNQIFHTSSVFQIKIYNASDFEIKSLQGVKFWKVFSIRTCKFLLTFPCFFRKRDCELKTLQRVKSWK